MEHSMERLLNAIAIKMSLLEEESKNDLDKNLQIQSRLEQSALHITETKDKLRYQLNNLGEAKRLIVEAAASVDEILEQKEFDPDDIIVPCGALHKQFIELMSEDRALTDVLYELFRKLHNQDIELQAYMKAVGDVARRQFKTRVLMRKVLTVLYKQDPNIDQSFSTASFSSTINQSFSSEASTPTSLPPRLPSPQPPLPSGSLYPK